MAFQFQCPQGHLLEGDESQAGQAINCPVCTMLFIIPAPLAAAAPEPPTFASEPTPPTPPPEPEILHIPCPNGHKLEVTPEMLETTVQCPQCLLRFRLQASNSIEHRRRRAEERVVREKKTNDFWFKFSIGTAVGVVLLLGSLMVMSALNKDPQEKPPKKPKPEPEEVEPETMPEEDSVMNEED